MAWASWRVREIGLACWPRQMIRAAKRLCLMEMETWLRPPSIGQREYHWPRRKFERQPVCRTDQFGRRAAGCAFRQLTESLGSYSATNSAGIVFSRDGQTLYVSEALGNGRVVTALAAGNLLKLGQVSDLAVQGTPTASKKLMIRNLRGVAAIAASVRSTSPHRACSLFPHLLSLTRQRSCLLKGRARVERPSPSAGQIFLRARRSASDCKLHWRQTCRVVRRCK